MSKIALTDIYIRALPSPSKGQTEVWDAKLAGFGIGDLMTSGRQRPEQSKTRTRAASPFNAIGKIGLIEIGQHRQQAASALVVAIGHGRVRTTRSPFL